jgi:hypothetical protein
VVHAIQSQVTPESLPDAEARADLGRNPEAALPVKTPCATRWSEVHTPFR